ncbi:MAG: glycosyltransferase, partial [Gemmatimonadales bacterium]
MSERALVVVPTYNERVNLPLIVPLILQQDSRIEVLVVDDNSPDGTGQLADEMAAQNRRIHVLHRPGKAGLGKAYLAGFRWALECGYDFIFEMDADFSHDPQFLPEFLQAIETADLVIGSRYRAGVNVINWPISRLLLSLGANE